MPTATLTKLHESVKSGNHKVDREDGVIRDVRILGRESKNGRRYSQNALEEACKLYQNIKVNLDHPDRSNPGAERKFEEGFGELRNCKVCTSGVYGDLHFPKSHPKTDLVCEYAERFPRQFGLSHNAEGEVVQHDGGFVVESIDAVYSVDIVGCPATNRGLFESLGRGRSGRTIKKTRRQIVRETRRYMVRTGRLVRGLDPLLEAMHSGLLNPNAEIEVPDVVESSAEDALEAAMMADAKVLDLVSVPTRMEEMKETIIGQLSKKSTDGTQTAEEIQRVNDAMDNFIAMLKKMFPTEFSDELKPGGTELPEFPGSGSSSDSVATVEQLVSRLHTHCR